MSQGCQWHILPAKINGSRTVLPKCLNAGRYRVRVSIQPYDLCKDHMEKAKKAR